MFVASFTQLQPVQAAADDIADFNGDGYVDLAGGVPPDLVSSVLGGSVNVIYGSSSGLSVSSPVLNQLWTQESQSVDGAAGWADSLGEAVASG